MIDLRSDTFTCPTKSMREAMATAKVGDDVYGEDPTVRQLEKKLAAMFGMDLAMFFPSGTMANQTAIKLHTNPGDQVICDKYSHVYNYEAGAGAFTSGVSFKLIDGEMIILKKGEQHRPFATEECQVLIIEPRGVVNTGDSVGDLTSENDMWI